MAEPVPDVEPVPAGFQANVESAQAKLRRKHPELVQTEVEARSFWIRDHGRKLSEHVDNDGNKYAWTQGSRPDRMFCKIVHKTGTSSPNHDTADKAWHSPSPCTSYIGSTTLYTGSKDRLPVPHGAGVSLYSDGSEFAGDFCDGLRCGKGTLTTSTFSYTGSWLHDQPNGKGARQHLEPGGVFYNGCFLNGLMHGEGVLTETVSGGSGVCVTKGTWSENILNGKGETLLADGDHYKGCFYNGLRSGHGVYTSTDGSVFEGEWAKDVQCGRGQLTFGTAVFVSCLESQSNEGRVAVDLVVGDQQAVYVGEFRRGLLNGYGKLHLPDGGHFEGLFLDGLPHDHGTMRFPSGAQLSGEFKYGHPSEGTMIYEPVSVQERYTGQWGADARKSALDFRTLLAPLKGTGSLLYYCADVLDRNLSALHNAPSGSGCMEWADGSSYDGQWLSGQRHGVGTMRKVVEAPEVFEGQGEEVYWGEWQSDLHHGSGTHVLPQDTSSYTGCWQGGKRHGQGTYKREHPFAVSYCGSWDNGLRSGSALSVNSVGDQYQGQFENNLKWGRGTMIYKSEKFSYEGQFAHNYRHGNGQHTYPDGRPTESVTFFCEHSCGEMNQIMSPANPLMHSVEWTVPSADGDSIPLVQYTEEERRFQECDIAAPYSDPLYVHAKIAFQNGDAYLGDVVVMQDMTTVRIIGSGAMKYADGSHYAGHWDADVAQGKGCMTLPHSDSSTGTVSFKGNFAAGQPVCGNAHVTFNGVVSNLSFETPGMPANDGPVEAHFNVVTYDDGSVYSGQWLNWVCSGQGEMRYSKCHGARYEGQWQSRYEGQWQENLRHGNSARFETQSEGGKFVVFENTTWHKDEIVNGSSGTVIHFNGQKAMESKYDGQLVAALPEDEQGHLLTFNGSEGCEGGEQSLDDLYIGAVSDGVRHGMGIETFKSRGFSLSGRWLDGAPPTKAATLEFLKSGDRYKGEIDDQFLPHGVGTLTWKSGAWFSGRWDHGLHRVDGAGELQYDAPDASSPVPRLRGLRPGRYVGQFLNEMRHGDGKFFQEEESCYTGQWSNNLRHGTGTQKNTNSDLYVGAWRQGMRTGSGSYTRADTGYVMKGEFVDDELEGTASATSPAGDVNVGTWVKGKQHGEGKIQFANGDVMTGTWKRGGLHGDTIRTFKDGRILYSSWVDGKPTGQGIMKSLDGTAKPHATIRSDGDFY